MSSSLTDEGSLQVVSWSPGSRFSGHGAAPRRRINSPADRALVSTTVKMSSGSIARPGSADSAPAPGEIRPRPRRCQGARVPSWSCPSGPRSLQDPEPGDGQGHGDPLVADADHVQDSVPDQRVGHRDLSAKDGTVETQLDHIRNLRTASLGEPIFGRLVDKPSRPPDASPTAR